MTATLNVPQTTDRGATIIWTASTPACHGGNVLTGDLLGRTGKPVKGYVVAKEIDGKLTLPYHVNGTAQRYV